MLDWHYVKGVRIRGFSGPYFPAFGLNTDRYSVSLHIQSEYGKIRTRKILNTDTFHAVQVLNTPLISNEVFPRKIYLINVTKSQASYEFNHIY